MKSRQSDIYHFTAVVIMHLQLVVKWPVFSTYICSGNFCLSALTIS